MGLLGVCILSIVTPYAEAYLQASGLSATYLPTGVFILFLLMLGVNTLLRFTPWPLAPQELMLAYVTMLIPSAIPSEALSLRLVPLLVELHYYATPVNEWSIRHFPHVRGWMTPGGDDVITGFFVGLPKGQPIPWGPWIRPLALWALLAMSLYMMMASLSLVFRRRWMDAERLQFPLAQIPLIIMSDDPAPSYFSTFFRQPGVWLGAAIPFLIHTISGLHVHFPAVPMIRLTDLRFGDLFSGSHFFTDPPFSRWADVRINFYWSIIGISYLLRSEVSLSVWVFEWFYNLEDVAFEVSGIGHGRHEWTPLHSFGFTLMSRYQRIGAMIVVSAIFLWASRDEIRQMLRAALTHGRSGAAKRSVPGWTFWVFLSGLAIYLVWTRAAGMELYASVILLFFLLVVAVTIARIVAATGLLWLWDFFMPMHGLSDTVGTARIDPQTWTNVGMVSFATQGSYNNTMPQTLDGLKIMRQTAIRQWHFLLGMVLGIITAIVVSFAAVLWLAYRYGGQNLDAWHFKDGGSWLFDRVAGFERYSTFTNWTVLGCVGAGGAVMGTLLYLHRTFLWWPLYPLGFITGGMRASAQMWFPVFLGWLLKRVVLRIGGSNGLSRFRYVALGFILGEFVSVGLWLVIDALTGTTMHRVFPAWAPS